MLFGDFSSMRLRPTEKKASMEMLNGAETTSSSSRSAPGNVMKVMLAGTVSLVVIFAAVVIVEPCVSAARILRNATFSERDGVMARTRNSVVGRLVIYM